MCARMCRAVLARRLPFAASEASCESRMRTIASSAATKNPFSMTRSSTARIFSAIKMTACQFISNSSSCSSSSSSSFFCFEDDDEDEHEQDYSQFHFSEHHFQNVLQGHNANLCPLARQHNGHALSGALLQTQRHLEPDAFVHKHRWNHVSRGRCLHV